VTAYYTPHTQHGMLSLLYVAVWKNVFCKQLTFLVREIGVSFDDDLKIMLEDGG
jgi:hypothetical protein